MNWTGGKLQRHSKANSNALVKAQKDHFARARLRRSTNPIAPNPLHISTAVADHQQRHFYRSRDHNNLHATIDEDPLRTHSRRRHSPQPTRRNPLPIASDQVPIRNGRTNFHDSHHTISPQVNTLEHVRNKLLKESDWLRLAPIRPPKPDCRPTTSLEQVGRRRRVTREDQQRQTYGIGNRKVEHNLIKPFAQTYDTVAAQSRESEDISIRIGSNIHQSQAAKSQHRSERLGSTVPESSSTDPMLLDMVEKQLPLASKEQGQYYLNDENNEEDLADFQAAIDENALIPLERAREFASFDEVKAYSSSEKQTTSTAQSKPKERLQASVKHQYRPQHLTSSSLVQARRSTDRVFSSSGKSRNTAFLNSETPSYTKHPEDAVMKDVELLQESSQASRASLKAYNKASPDDRNPQLSFERIARIEKLFESVPHCSSNKSASRDLRVSDTCSARYERPPYTLERQVEFEAKLSRRETHLRAGTRPENETGLLSGEPESNVVDGARAPGMRNTKTRYLTREAMRNNDHDSHSRSSIARTSPAITDQRQRQGDANEAWMRDVFSTDFDKLQQRFSFAKAPTRKATNQTPPQPTLSREVFSEGIGKSGRSGWLERASQHSDSSFPKTIKTAANTTLNMRSEWSHRENVFLPSGTDFLTQLDPMTGYLEEHFTDISTYNNAAQTIRSFVEAPPVLRKRSASDAFGDDSYDQNDQSSLSDSRTEDFGTSAVHRVPLDTLYQVPLRGNPHCDGPVILRRGEQHISKPIWRHAKAPSPLKISRSIRELSSSANLQLTQTPPRETAHFSLNYTSGQTHTRSCLEGQTQAIQAPASYVDSQFSSPTTSSLHRVPLSSGHGTEMMDAGINDRAFINTPFSKDRIVTSGARLGTSTSPRFVNAASTSSSSKVSTYSSATPAANIHVDDTQPFVFKRPHRPPSHYCHPSRTPQFKILAPIPLH